MAIRSAPLVPSSITRTLICIDSVDDSIITGSLRNPCFPSPIPFQDVDMLMSLMERFFEIISYPQANFRFRSFEGRDSSIPFPHISALPSPHTFDLPKERGAVCTFLLHVKLRKSASWQGILYCLEEDQEWAIHSDLEFILLLERTLCRRFRRRLCRSWSASQLYSPGESSA